MSIREWLSQEVSLVAGKPCPWTAYNAAYSDWHETGNIFRLWNINDNITYHQRSVSTLAQLNVEISVFSVEEPFTPVVSVDDAAKGFEGAGTAKDGGRATLFPLLLLVPAVTRRSALK